jgi:hypothetical protein
VNLRLLTPRRCPGGLRDPHTTFWLNTPPRPVAYQFRHTQAYPAPRRGTRRAPTDRSGTASHTLTQTTCRTNKLGGLFFTPIHSPYVRKSVNAKDSPYRHRVVVRVIHRLLIDKVVRSSGGELFDAVVEARWVHGVHLGSTGQEFGLCQCVARCYLNPSSIPDNYDRRIAKHDAAGS